jgi:hypothetical protein
MTTGIWHVRPCTQGQKSVLSVLSMSKVECIVGSTQGEPLWMVIYSGQCWVLWYSNIGWWRWWGLSKRRVATLFHCLIHVKSWMHVGLNDLVGDANDIEMSIMVKRIRKPIKKKVRLPRLRTRLPNRDADEFWNYLQVLLLFITFFISYIFSLILY